MINLFPESDLTKVKKAVGRPRLDFPPLVRTEILNLLAKGIGRRAICHRLNIGYARFLRNLATDREFGDQVVSLEEKRAEDCAGVLYQLALGPYDSSVKARAAIAYLGRKDRVDAANFAREKAAKP